MPLFRHHAASALLALALIQTGCGGGGYADEAPAPPAAVQVDAARTTRTTVDAAAGGTVTATAADGRRYTLTVPPGALASTTEITATPVTSMGDAPLAAGLKAAVRFGPSGLQFARAATLRIEGSGLAPSAGTALVGFLRSTDGRSMQLVPPVASTGAVEIRVQHFSDIGVAEATPQQVAQVPTDPAASAADALLDEYARQKPSSSTNFVANAELLVRLHDARVAPALTVAQASADAAVRARAVKLAETWLLLFTFTAESSLPLDQQPAGLGAIVSSVRTRMLELLRADFEAGRSACMAPAPIGAGQRAGLEQALQARESAVFATQTGIVTETPGLDADTVARRLNDCVRVVFVPKTPPVLEVGRPVSLDAQAELIFAADANASVPVPFAFEVRSSEATVASPTGFSDANGNYTTVVTPSNAQATFDVRACMVVTLRDGGPVASAMCGRQTVGAAITSVVLAGRVTVDRGPATSNVRGSVDFRVRVGVDGTITVVEALGTVTQTSTFAQQCRPNPTAELTEVTLRSQTVDSVTQGRVFQSPSLPPQITAFGPGVRTTQFIEDPSSTCTIATTTRNIIDSDVFSSATVTTIEIGPDGLPTAWVFAGGGYSGRLQRE